MANAEICRKTLGLQHIVRPLRQLDLLVLQNYLFTVILGPFCQISTAPSPLPQGLRDPPAYSPPPSPRPTHATLSPTIDSDLPPYSSIHPSLLGSIDSKSSVPLGTPAPDVLHFLKPEDTLQSLSLAYTTPVGVLRRTNNLFSDHLLAARRTILVPGEYYKGGVSLSPRPVEGEEEELKKSKVRRWMVACKVAEYVYTQCFALFNGFSFF